MRDASASCNHADTLSRGTGADNLTHFDTAVGGRQGDVSSGVAGRAALAAAFVGLAAGCGPDSGGNNRGANTDAASAESHYVGGEVCAACHVREAELWRGSHHDLAMQPARADTVLGDFDDASIVHDGIETRFFMRDGSFFVRTEGPDGAPGEFRVTHVFGVEPLQQYLLDVGGGRLQALTIAWDSRPRDEGGQRWFDLYPDEHIRAGDPLHWSASAFNWNSRCAACHSTSLEKRYEPAADTYATAWASIDVDCEACHGPGSAHVEAPDEVAMAYGSKARAWSFAPESHTAMLARVGNGQDEIETCALCHSRRAQIEEPLVAAARLLDQVVPARLARGLYHDDGQILDEVFEYGSFVQSAMYRAGVTCSDCHDPHSTALLAEGNALCTRCHAPSAFDTPEHHRHAPSSAGSFCVDCHMPATKYMVVDPRRDHGLRVPRPDLTVTLGTPNACNACHTDESAEWAAERVAEWFPHGRGGEFHYGEAIAAGRRYAADRLPKLRSVVDDPTVPGIARATAVALLAEQPDPGTEALLARALEDDDPLVQLAAVESAAALPDRARVSLVQRFLTHPLKALRMAAAEALAADRSLVSDRRRTDLNAAIDEYLDVQARDSDRAEGWSNRGAMLMRLGRVDDAEAAFREAIAREPAFAASYVNLSDLHRLRGDERAAEAVLREGLERNSDAPELHYALGLALTRAGRRDEALEALENAAALAPWHPLYAYAAGLGLDALGRREAAIARLEQVAETFPAYAPALQALATMERDRGNATRALDWARRLAVVSPGNAAAEALTVQLERSVGAR